MNAQKYNDIICKSVADCTKEMKSLMEERGLVMVDFVEHDIQLPSTVFENEDSGDYYFEDIESISLLCGDIIIKGESGITGYLDGIYGDYFKVADSIGGIYRALIESLERVDEGLSHFTKEELEEKYTHGVTKDMWGAIIILLNLSREQANDIESMRIVESDDKFDFIYIDFNDKFYGANFCVIRDKKNDDIYMPQNGGAYPATLKDIAMYTWVNVETEKIMLNTNNEMEKYDNTTNERLVYLNKNFPDIFDGISFVWHKNHTMCVKSKKDERNGDTKTTYVAIYDEHTDIVPIKLSKMEKLDVEFPPLF